MDPRGVALAAIVTIGLARHSESKSPSQPKGEQDHRGGAARQARRRPPALAALHREANDLLPGARRACRRGLRAVRGPPGGRERGAPGATRAGRAAVLQRVAGLGQARPSSASTCATTARAISPAPDPADLPVLRGPDGKIANGYGLVGTPATIYYDAAGKQTYIHQGQYLDRAQLDDDIKRYATS
jgi:hypothetical protein